MAKPTPRVVSEVCSVCGLDWQRHGKAPTLETCVRLLLDEVRMKEAALAQRPRVYPLTVPYPVYPRPYWPTWYSTYGINTGSTVQGLTTFNYTSGLSPQPLSIGKGDTA